MIQGGRVLLADAEPMVRQVVLKLLEWLGFEVQIVSSEDIRKPASEDPSGHFDLILPYLKGQGDHPAGEGQRTLCMSRPQAESEP